MTLPPPPVSRALTALNIPHTLFRHPGPVHSLEQAARERGQTPGQVIRSILFRQGEGKFILALVAGEAQISWPKLRALLGQSRLSLASEEQVLEVTGYRIGAVAPIGLPAPLPILADESIFAHETISIGSGERNTAVLMRSNDLKTCLPGLQISQLI